ncbi:hypothetical protein ACFSTA_06960 [Ornithinibacillus salinisoli]|uniref:Uncharacterized protein n=1 Tax=Ornithinibacillus salinisoli TaxID=1848459 RepID=A0ABW4VVZ5_9BACI
MKNNKTNAKKRFGTIKSYQEINKDIAKNKQQPVPQPKDYDEIEY